LEEIPVMMSTLTVGSIRYGVMCGNDGMGQEAAMTIPTRLRQPETYPTGVRVSDAQLAALPLTRHDWHGDWNYTLRATRRGGIERG
jgi:hypothetical protein